MFIENSAMNFGSFFKSLILFRNAATVSETPHLRQNFVFLSFFIASCLTMNNRLDPTKLHCERLATLLESVNNQHIVISTHSDRKATQKVISTARSLATRNNTSFITCAESRPSVLDSSELCG